MGNDNNAEALEVETPDESGVAEEAQVEGSDSVDEVEVKEVETEAWMQVDEEESQPEGEEKIHKPVKLSTKQRLRANLETSESENEQLKRRIADLEKGQKSVVADVAVRPKRDDFEDDNDYDEAYDKYRDQKDAAKDSVRDRVTANARHQQGIEESVDSHYERVDDMVVKHSISEDAYKEADKAIRTVAESAMPGNGTGVINDIISILGDGSEKVFFRVGKSPTLISQFRTMLDEDKRGLKALAFMIEQKAVVNNTQTRTSQAPKPAAQVNGDEPVTAKAGSFKKKYDKAEPGQARYNAKKEAKAAGVDTSKWK